MKIQRIIFSFSLSMLLMACSLLSDEAPTDEGNILVPAAPALGMAEDVQKAQSEVAEGTTNRLSSTATPANAGEVQTSQLKVTLPTATSAPLVLGPDKFPDGVNPLTGLSVDDPALLVLPPALVSVTNFPASARPQAGLSSSPYIFEMYIGEGMTRFLALFYGEYPEAAPAGDGSTVTLDKSQIGPIRSGRLPYQALHRLYNGFLVMASASAEVRAQITGSVNIYGNDEADINSAMIDVTKLKAIAEANVSRYPLNLTGNAFTNLPPAGGKEADKLWVFYSYLNQVMWEYDPATGAYLRFQDKADGSGKFYPATDRLNGEQLAFENVVLLFVNHEVLNRAGTLIDLELLYNQGYAYLLRDGTVYKLRWSTANGDYEKATGRLRPIRFTDEYGNPLPFKPGSTWVEIVDVTTTFQELQPGTWKARFYMPQQD